MLYLSIYLAMLVGAFCTIVALTAMRRREKHNIGKFGWLCLLLLTPPIGLVLFLIFATTLAYMAKRQIWAEKEH